MTVTYGKVSSDGLNVHRLPRASSKVVDQLDHGDEVIIHETRVVEVAGKTYTWLNITSVETAERDQVFGWVDARFIKVDEPEENVSPLVPWISVALLMAGLGAIILAAFWLPN